MKQITNKEYGRTLMLLSNWQEHSILGKMILIRKA